MIASYTRHSPSALNIFAASPALFVLERMLGYRQPKNAPMCRGSAVEDGVSEGLKNPEAPIEDCVSVAMKRYDKDTSLMGDRRREEYRETIPGMVRAALTELRPYGVPDKLQSAIEWRPEGLKLPIFGYSDFEWSQHGIVVDLKATEKMPSAVKQPHAKQVAFYSGSDNIDGRVTYVTPRKCTTYKVDNIREHRQALYNTALAVERFLSLSEDPQFFVGITVPDLDSFYWGNPEVRQLAFEHWKI